MKEELIEIIKFEDIYNIISDFNKDFEPSLENRVGNLKIYSQKIFKYGFTYGYYIDEKCIGFVSFYSNDCKNKVAYLAEIAVKKNYFGKNISNILIEKCIEISKLTGMNLLKLQVNKKNGRAISFYKKIGFEYLEDCDDDNYFYMVKKLK
jgi:ribosomal protein S18 acetylase RimI-like enzyme